MKKRESAKEAKRQQEIASIESELRLMAMGAMGSAYVDPEESGDLFSVFDADRFSRWLTAVESYWAINKREQESKFMTRPHNLDTWAKSYTRAAEFLYEQGARAGGEWIA